MEPNKTTAKDVFVYLGIFITLIVSVYNIIEIVFSAIDIKWPDVMDLASSYDIYNDGVRMAIASLLVLYPLFVLFSYLASKDVKLHPAKKEMKIRKGTIYTALFVTTCTLVGTLISIIYTFLGGELSTRFGLKALFIIFISLCIFGYYYYLTKRDYTAPSKVPLYIGIVVSLFVIGSVIWSIMMIGTPSEMRVKRLDNTRLMDLSNIQQQVFTRFQNKAELPATLTELNDAFAGFVMPVDPVTKAPYEYRVLKQGALGYDAVTGNRELKTPASFELCATFDAERELAANGMPTDEKTMYSVNNYYYQGDRTPFWNHKAGRTCFTRVITSDMYYGGK